MKWLCTVGVAVSLALQPALADELFGNHPLTPQARDAFVTDLLKKMTVDEKIGQLRPISVGPDNPKEAIREMIKNGQVGAIFNTVTRPDIRVMQDQVMQLSRLKIPLFFAYDVLHGQRTVFPISLGLASSFNLDAVKTVGRVSAYEAADDKLGFYTPILKGFLTELGLEAANHGIQVYGGHGFIKEWGMEQIARDARISTLYEGTTGVQALDLLGRKVLLSSKGKVVRDYTAEILKFCAAHARNKYLRRFAWDLAKLCAQWNTLTVRIMLAARKDRDIVSSASNDFLMFSGYVMMAYFWAQQAVIASEKLEAGNGAETPEFYKAKIKVADFYFDRILPRTQGHAESAVTPSKTLIGLPAEHFSFDY